MISSELIVNHSCQCVPVFCFLYWISCFLVRRHFLQRVVVHMTYSLRCLIMLKTFVLEMKVINVAFSIPLTLSALRIIFVVNGA